MEKAQLDIKSFPGDIDTFLYPTDFDEFFSKHFHHFRFFKIRWDIAVGAHNVDL